MFACLKTLAVTAAVSSVSGVSTGEPPEQLVCSGPEPIPNVFNGEEPCVKAGVCSTTHWISRWGGTTAQCLRAPTCDEIVAESGPLFTWNGEFGIGLLGKRCRDPGYFNTSDGFPFASVKMDWPDWFPRWFRKARYASYCVTQEATDKSPAKVGRIKTTTITLGSNLFAAVSDMAGCAGQVNELSPENPYNAPCGETYAKNGMDFMIVQRFGGKLETKTMTIGGMVREYIVYTSALAKATAAQGGKAPMVVEMHGYGGCAEYQPLYSKWIEIAVQEGLIYVLPQATQLRGQNIFDMKIEDISSWNVGLVRLPATTANVSDSDFIVSLVKDVIATEPGDESRVYLAGHSNGAAMANRVAYENPELFAGQATHSLGLLSNFDPTIPMPDSVKLANYTTGSVEAVVAGVLGYNDVFPLATVFRDAKMPSYFVHGVLDRVVDYDFCSSFAPYNMKCPKGQSPGAQRNAAVFGLLNGCFPVGNETSVNVFTFSGCQGSSGFDDNKEVEVKLLSLPMGSHMPYAGSLDGQDPPQIELTDSTRMAWAFLKDYKRV